jgi:hypothetical protein
MRKVTFRTALQISREPPTDFAASWDFYEAPRFYKISSFVEFTADFESHEIKVVVECPPPEHDVEFDRQPPEEVLHSDASCVL